MTLLSGPSEQADRISASSQRSRVLHVINGEHFAGAERVQDLLAMRLPEYRYDVQFVCLKSGVFREVRESDVPLHDLQMTSRFDQAVVSRLGEVIEEVAPHVIHAHTPRSSWVASRAARRYRLPFVYHVHSPTSRDSTRRILNWVNQRVERNAMRDAAALITVSNSLSQHMRSMGIDQGKLHVVPNGVAPRPPVARLVPTADWMLGTIALFRPRKGTEVLIEALAVLKQLGTPVRLVAVGGFESNSYQTQLRKLASQFNVDDRIEWVGFTREIDTQLQRMDALVLPSLFGEGLPMVVLEAMASAVPVIASAVEGVPEAIRDGREGLLARPGDAAHLAERIHELISGKYDWSEMRMRAQHRQREMFSTDSMAAGVAHVYDQVLGLRTPSCTSDLRQPSEPIPATSLAPLP